MIVVTSVTAGAAVTAHVGAGVTVIMKYDRQSAVPCLVGELLTKNFQIDVKSTFTGTMSTKDLAH